MLPTLLLLSSPVVSLPCTSLNSTQQLSNILLYSSAHLHIRKSANHLFNHNITAAVAIIFNSANGINFFHPRFINWSYRKRGMVQRIQINTNRKKMIFVMMTLKLINVSSQFGISHAASFTNGISYPPKYKVDITAALTNILMYSANR